MHLQLQPLLPTEEEMSQFQNVAYSAFATELMLWIYPNGFTPAAQHFSTTHALSDWEASPSVLKYMKIVDADLVEAGEDPLGGVVGVARWHFYPQDRGEAEMEAEREKAGKREAPPDANGPLLEDFRRSLEVCKKEILGGKAHVLLGLLTTRPEYQRRGVGGMLLAWGLGEADRLGLPVYLEASPVGEPLYRRCGFGVVRDLPFDKEKWGVVGERPHVVMLRPTGEGWSREVVLR